MVSRKQILLLLVLALVVAGGFYLLVHRNLATRGHAITQSIASLDISRLPDSFRARLIAAERAARTSSPTEESILELARLYHANGFPEEAVSRYQLILDSRTKEFRAKAHYYLANIEKGSSDFRSAIEHLESTITLEPRYLPALLSLGEIHYKTGNSKEAVTLYKAVLNIDARNPHALLGLARDRIQNQDNATALTYLESLAAAHPDFTNGASLQAQVLERIGQSEKAALARSRSLAGWDLTPEDPWMDQTMALCYDPQRLSILFEDYKRVGQIERAMTYLDRIEEVDPNNWNCRLLRAQAHAEQGEFEKSIPYCQKALELGGDASVIYPFLAKAYFESGRYQEAENAARKGIAQSPKDPEVLVTMAGIHLQNEEPDQAIALFQKVVSLDPTHLLANTVLAKYHWQTGNRTEALNHLKMIQQIDPRDLFSRVFLGQYYLESNQPFEALQPLEQAYAIDPKDEYVLIMLPDAYAMIGKFQQNKGDFMGAMESYGKAIAIDSNHAAAAEGKASLLDKSSHID